MSGPNREEYRATASEQDRIADLMRLVPPGFSTVLDVGARDGYLSKCLTEHFESVTALDLEKPQFEYDRVTTVQGDATALAYPDNAFDVVFCAEVLEHVPPTLLPKACSELARVAKHFAVIGVPYNQDTRVGRTTCQECGVVNPPWGHVNIFTEKNLATLFEPLSVATTSFVGTTKDRTNFLSTALYDFSGNPWGVYGQGEPCISCDKQLGQPAERTPIQKIASKLAFELNRLQRSFEKVEPFWIHMVFKKSPS